MSLRSRNKQFNACRKTETHLSLDWLPFNEKIVRVVVFFLLFYSAIQLEIRSDN